MAFAQDNGYTPATIEAIMDSLRQNINTQFGTTYTAESFVGTNFYKYFYALAQRLQENEVKTSEIFLKLQQYIAVTNESISRPVVTNPGLVEKFAAEGYTASVKPMIEADAGTINICVDVDETETDPPYSETKLAICELIRDSTVAGAVTMGDQVESIVLSNGQSFDFKFVLPNRIHVGLRLTIATSENNQLVIDSPEETKLQLLANIAEKYKLGKNFEPQRYFGIVDAPWAASVLLEWTDDVTETSPGVWEIDVTPTWHSTVYDAEFDDLFVIDLELVELVET